MTDTKSSASAAYLAIAAISALIFGAMAPVLPFEKLRPSEKVAPAAKPDPHLIEARLWEDPFAALFRADAVGNKPCEAQAPASAPVAASAPAPAIVSCPTDAAVSSDAPLLLAVAVKGGSFLGAEEARRRTRFAVLSGLQAACYVPGDGEHLHLAKLDGAVVQPPSLPSSASKPSQYDFSLPYEHWILDQSRRSSPACADRYEKVTVLWVNESRLPPTARLDGLARLLGHIDVTTTTPEKSTGAPDAVRAVAVIGPTDSDGLQESLVRLKAMKVSEVAKGDEKRTRGYVMLAHGRIFNASATVPLGALSALNANETTKVMSPDSPPSSPPLFDDPLQRFAAAEFKRIAIEAAQQFKSSESPSATPTFQRTIATDDVLVKLLVDELRARVDLSKNRIVLVAEGDTEYGRAMVRLVEEGLCRNDLCPIVSSNGTQSLPQRLSRVYYFAGLDGVTGKEAATSEARRDASPNKAEADAGLIEWPESSAQLDYLRRTAEALRRSETEPDALPIGAIGVLGSEVHDKLLVLQALHASFSDKVFFTTDMDARFLHPRVLPFTRNLIVASSLPLVLPATMRVYSKQDMSGHIAFGEGTPPLRDTYQTASFLAARAASCQSENCRHQEFSATQTLLAQPLLVEIGRSRAVALNEAAAVAEVKSPRAVSEQDLVAGLLLALAFFAWFVWPSTPSLRLVRGYLLGRAGVGVPDAFARLMGVVQITLMVYIGGSLAMFLHPGRMSFRLMIACCAWVLVLLAWRLRARELVATVSHVPWYRSDWASIGAGLVAVLAVVVWPPGDVAKCQACEPVAWLEGVSAWPSHWLHSIALVITVVSLDHVWDDGWRGLLEDEKWLGLGSQAQTPIEQSAAVWRDASVLGWRRPDGHSLSFVRLWDQFRVCSSAWPRCIRLGLGYLLTVGVTCLTFHAFSEGQMPEVPVRGAEHKQLVTTTLALLLLLFPLLVVAVADATALACRFIGHLDTGRSDYPVACVERFARALGTQDQSLWSCGMEAKPKRRVSVPGAVNSGAHTLLDNWIDMQLVARCTERVATLVIGPFVVLAVMVVARSRVFDNWAVTPVVVVTVGVYLLALIAVSVALCRGAERSRERALKSMQADLLWIKGSGEKWQALVPTFETLIERVRTLRTGAFAATLEQPLLRALLLPVAGAGASRVIEYFLRSG